MANDFMQNANKVSLNGEVVSFSNTFPNVNVKTEVKIEKTEKKTSKKSKKETEKVETVVEENETTIETNKSVKENNEFSETVIEE